MRTNCRSFAFAQDDNLALSSRVSGATRDLLLYLEESNPRSSSAQDDKQRPLPSLVWDAAAKRHFRLDKSDATCIKYFRFHLACRMPHSKIQANAPLSGVSSGADHVPFNADQGGPRRETDDFKAPRNEESQRKSLRRTPLRHPGGKDPPRHPPCGTYAGGEHGHQQDARP